jgi:hypothetical protein
MLRPRSATQSEIKHGPISFAQCRKPERAMPIERALPYGWGVSGNRIFELACCSRLKWSRRSRTNSPKARVSARGDRCPDTFGGVVPVSFSARRRPPRGRVLAARDR